MLEQHGENRERLLLEMNPYAALAQLACLEIHIEKAKANGLQCRRDLHVTT